MKLLVDSGNSRLKWACIDQGKMASQQSADGGAALTQSTLDGIWGKFDPAPRQIWIANVAGKGVAELMKRWIGVRWQICPNFVYSQAAAHGVTNGYREPCKLGVDRWLALVGACHLRLLPACIVDCGTALTLDVLDRRGNHLGGLISPGLMLMARSLGKGTAEVRFDTIPDTLDSVLADETVTAVGSGICHSAAGMIERVVNRLMVQRPDLHLVLTGGDAATISGMLAFESIVVPDLVLRGLAEVSRRP